MEIVISKKCLIDFESVAAFGRIEFLKYRGQDYGYIYGYLNGALKFCLPFILKRKFGFSLLEFQTKIITCGHADVKNEQLFIDMAVKKVFLEMDVDFICQNPAYAIFGQKPDKAEWIEFGTYVIDLKQDIDLLWKNVHSKHRNVIRRAEKNGVSVFFEGDYLGEAYELIKETQERSARAFIGYDNFCELIRAMPGNVKIVAAFDGDDMQGCAVIVLDKVRAYYLYGGSKSNPSLGAVNYMHWELIKELKANGVNEYDFVGARLSDDISEKLQGIQRFKKRFGGELKQGYLWKVINKRWKYNLYKILTKLLNKTKFVDAIDEEKAHA